MNVMVSLSPAPKAHPPRSNPFLRSSSDAPPFPCITPSTVTCVMVVSFMVAAPFSLVTVDGVMQGNGGASDEDRRNGFERGGWAMGVADNETMTFINQTYQRPAA